MKKYKVEAQTVTAAQVRGEDMWDGERFMVDDDYTEAETAEEAIELVKLWLINEHGYEYGAKDIYLRYDDEGNVIDGWAFFSAEEVK